MIFYESERGTNFSHTQLPSGLILTRPMERICIPSRFFLENFFQIWHPPLFLINHLLAFPPIVDAETRQLVFSFLEPNILGVSAAVVRRWKKKYRFFAGTKTG